MDKTTFWELSIAKKFYWVRFTWRVGKWLMG
nr:MAG TPA: hypothetical protein [Caudoviricetes sp.]